MKIAIGGISHETNTFAEGLTTFEYFLNPGGHHLPLLKGQQIISAFTGLKTGMGGFIAAGNDSGVELAPLIWASPLPSGIVARDAWNRFSEMFFAQLKQVLPVDGVVLDMHGAMSTEDFDDAEGELLERIRKIIGPDLPLVSILDLHANITPRMAENADALVGYDTYPHIDSFERGVEAMRIAVDAAKGNLKPVCELIQIPMLVSPPKQCTLIPPMRDIMNAAHNAEQKPGIISITVAGGFCFSDIYDAGFSVLVNTDNNRMLAQKTAAGIAEKIWERREDFRLQLAPLKQTIDKVVNENIGPVVFADGSDNPGGGAPCDGTVMLKALIDAKAPRSTVAVIADPTAVAAAIAAGVGNKTTLVIGGKTDDNHGAPLSVKGYVRVITDGRYVNRGPMFTGMQINMGRTVVFVTDGIEIILTEQRAQPYDMQVLRSVGIEPAERLIIGLKSAVHFQADYLSVAYAVYDVDTPGINYPDPCVYNYKKIRRPIWPLDKI